MMKKLNYFFIFLTLLSLLAVSCVKEDEIDTDPSVKLQFSTDTVLFDTIFTTVGSATQVFKIYNNGNKKINISSIHLGRGASSPYRFNIDGVSALEVNDIEIMAKDSAFVFVKVTIDPNEANAPLVQQDSLVFTINNNVQDVKLIAWGQDAHFYNRAIIGSDYVFEADKPHVIYNYLIVDSLYTLEIMAGAQVHLHAGAMLVVYNSGSLKVRGTKDNPVVFQGDRLEDNFKELPGQWGRIWLYPGSINNEIDWAIIKNGETGIQVDTTGNSTNPTLRISNSQIYNMTGIGLLAQGTTIEAANLVIGNCGSYTLALTLGGSYDFRHCTFANYWNNYQRQNGMILNNYYFDVNKNEQPRALEKAYFGNCIIYGQHNDELTLDKSKSSVAFNYLFDHCLIKTTLNTSNSENYIQTIKNQEPWFRDPQKFQYQPDSTISSVINKGSLDVINMSQFNLTLDLEGNSRVNDAAPDLGAYEFIETPTLRKRRY